MTTTSPKEPPRDSETTDETAGPPTKPRRDPYAEFDEGALAVETLKRFIAKQKQRGHLGRGQGRQAARSPDYGPARQ